MRNNPKIFADHLLEGACDSFLAPAFFRQQINTGGAICRYVSTCLSLMENYSHYVLCNYRKDIASTEFCSVVSDRLLKYAEVCIYTVKLSELVVYPTEREVVCQMLRRFYNSTATDEEMLVESAPFVFLYRILGPCRIAHWGTELKRAAESGVAPPFDGIATAIGIGPLWLFGRTNLSQDELEFHTRFTESLMQLVQKECKRI
jgi:hypothetical protein